MNKNAFFTCRWCSLHREICLYATEKCLIKAASIVEVHNSTLSETVSCCNHQDLIECCQYTVCFTLFVLV